MNVLEKILDDIFFNGQKQIQEKAEQDISACGITGTM